MVTFRNNNNRRPNFRRNDSNFKRNGGVSKFKQDFSQNSNFQRNSPGRNNHNASKLVEKYNSLAREALANEDKILSESYFQYADHYTRILNEQEKNKPVKIVETTEKVEEEKNISDSEPKENPTNK